VKLKFVAGSVPLLEDRIVAYRPAGSIIYELTLVTPASHYVEDEELFESIIGGFHLSKLPLGECSND
jgi:hypothetical protein